MVIRSISIEFLNRSLSKMFYEFYLDLINRMESIKHFDRIERHFYSLLFFMAIYSIDENFTNKYHHR